jgi:hypothetical protein
VLVSDGCLDKVDFFVATVADEVYEYVEEDDEAVEELDEVRVRLCWVENSLF